MLLFFDTETTGKADFKKPFDHPCQPRLVQLAARLYDFNSPRPLQSVALIVKPLDFTISKEVSAIHGITHEMASDLGVNPRFALDIFEDFLRRAMWVVGHNVAYDILVMSRERGSAIGHRSFCTMQSSTDLCKLTGQWGKYKWPKLSEVYRFAFGRDLQNAHDALVDITATKEVYDWLGTRIKTPSTL